MKKEWNVDPAEAGNIMEYISDEICSFLPEEKRMTTALLFEEAFMNVANHAYETQSSSKPLKIIFEMSKKQYLLTFVDYGQEFDPTLYVPKEPTGQEIGGHGIRLLKEISQSMKYKRTKDGQNILMIWL